MKEERLTVKGTTFDVVHGDGIWWAKSEDLPGTTVAARTREELQRLCGEMIDLRKKSAQEAR